VLLVGDDEVGMDEDLERSADHWFALYVAADIARRGSLDGEMGELGGAFAAGCDVADRVVDDRELSGGSSSGIDELEDEIRAMLVDDVKVPRGQVYVDEDGVVRHLDEGFLSYMCTMGRQKIFDDPGDVPSSVAYDGTFRNMDERVMDEWDSAMVATVDLNKPPNSLKEAMARSDWPRWKAAMDEEMERLNARGTFEVVDKPEGRGLVGLKWVFDIKYNPDGTVKKVKTRLVAQGFSQRPEDCGPTYMPTPAKESVNGTYAISAKWNHELYTLDITQAFTHSKIRSLIYCRQIPGYPEADPKLVLKLCMALYGLKQAAFEWYCLIFQVLSSIGLRRCELDHALFLGVWATPPADGIEMPSDGEPLRMIIPLHVDDGLASTNSEKLYLWMIGRIKEAGIAVVDLGPATMYLAARILRDRANRRLWLSISPFIVNMLEDWKMEFCHSAKTPMDTLPSQMPDAKLGVLTEHMPVTDFKKAYQSITGSLNYSSQTVRAELAFVVMVLGHHAANPEPKHMAAAKRVLRYLWGTKDYILMFDDNKDIDPAVNDLVRSATAFMHYETYFQIFSLVCPVHTCPAPGHDGILKLPRK
jgi:hypothetical protein